MPACSEISLGDVAYYESVVDLIGNTPLVRLRTVTAGLTPTVLAKIEYVNPGGSVKDRIAVRMIDAAEESGELGPGGTIVEPTSGNTGIGLAIVAQQRGYRCVFVCPDKVSGDKIDTLRAYGAEVVVCPTAVAPEDPRSYYSVSDRLTREIPGGWKPNQYANPNNPLSHYETTGPEIWEQTGGRVTHFVAGVGTGGTLMGVAHALRDHGYDTIIARAMPIATFGTDGDPEVVGGIPGIVEGMSQLLDPDAVGLDDPVLVPEREAIATAREFGRRGLGIGPSSGLNIAAARRLAARLGPGRHVATVLPDRMERYFSTALFDDVTAEL